MKRVVYVCFVLIFVCIAILSIMYMCRPYSPYVTVEKISAVFASHIKYDDTCYEMPVPNSVDKIIQFDEWKQINQKPEGEPMVEMHLAEQWVVQLFSEGYAAVHFGYASSKEKSSAYYSIPKNAAESVGQYAKDTGKIYTKLFADSLFLY